MWGLYAHALGLSTYLSIARVKPATLRPARRGWAWRLNQGVCAGTAAVIDLKEYGSQKRHSAWRDRVNYRPPAGNPVEGGAAMIAPGSRTHLSA